jgi:hypothetical protein
MKIPSTLNSKTQFGLSKFANPFDQLDPFFKEYYSGKNLVFVFSALALGVNAFFLSGDKMLGVSYLTKFPTLTGLLDGFGQFALLMMLYAILFLFSPKRKLQDMSLGRRNIAAIAVHSTFWESLLFYIGLFSLLSIVLKIFLPTQVLTAAYSQIWIVVFHYFSMQMPIGMNLSMLIAMLITNIVYALYHLNQVVVSENSFRFRSIDWLYFCFSLITSKAFFYNYFSHGLITALIVLFMVYLAELLMVRLMCVIRG